jgi:hypothetical protein
MTAPPERTMLLAGSPAVDQQSHDPAPVVVRGGTLPDSVKYHDHLTNLVRASLLCGDLM